MICIIILGYKEKASGNSSVIEFCSVPGSRKEIVDYIGKSKNHVMSQIVAPLVESGVLKMTISEKPKSSQQRFVKA